MINLVVNGVPFADFISASVTVALKTLANDFIFVASAVDDFPPFDFAPFKIGDRVVISVDGIKKVTGHIEEIDGEEAEGSHSIVYSGRDLTGDFFDSDINRIPDIQAGPTLTLKKIIETVISDLGQTLIVIDNLNPEPFNKAEDIIDPQVGENAFSFVMKYAVKRQALLSSNPDGNIVITQSQSTESGATLQRVKGSNSNNIITQKWKLKAKERFNKYIHAGQLDPRGINIGATTTTKDIENQNGESIDSEIRKGRQKVVVEKDSYSSDQLEKRAKWSNQGAKAKANRFLCTTKGHQKPKGGLWEENTLVNINSSTADITRPMLIDVLTFSQGEGQLTATSFEFVERNVYTIDEAVLSERPTGKQNKVFLG